MKSLFLFLSAVIISTAVYAENDDYAVGIGDIIVVNIIQPENSTTQSIVSPGGEISVPYIGTIKVKGKTLNEVQKLIQEKLSRGYLKYPIITVSLVESRSQNFTISGEVIRPGTYPLIENTTVLRAISTAGGFTRFGSSSKVKILRPKKNAPGYQSIEVNIKAVIEGKSEADILLLPGDIVVVSESLF